MGTKSQTTERRYFSLHVFFTFLLRQSVGRHQSCQTENYKISCCCFKIYILAIHVCWVREHFFAQREWVNMKCVVTQGWRCWAPGAPWLSDTWVFTLIQWVYWFKYLVHRNTKMTICVQSYTYYINPHSTNCMAKPNDRQVIVQL